MFDTEEDRAREKMEYIGKLREHMKCEICHNFLDDPYMLDLLRGQASVVQAYLTVEDSYKSVQERIDNSHDKGWGGSQSQSSTHSQSPHRKCPTSAMGTGGGWAAGNDTLSDVRGGGEAGAWAGDRVGANPGAGEGCGSGAGSGSEVRVGYGTEAEVRTVAGSGVTPRTRAGADPVVTASTGAKVKMEAEKSSVRRSPAGVEGACSSLSPPPSPPLGLMPLSPTAGVETGQMLAGQELSLAAPFPEEQDKENLEMGSPPFLNRPRQITAKDVRNDTGHRPLPLTPTGVARCTSSHPPTPRGGGG
ncbi:unnamed protein product [Discosporangium mesarthrocarpum]